MTPEPSPAERQPELQVVPEPPPLELSEVQIAGLARILGPVLERRLAARRVAEREPESKG